MSLLSAVTEHLTDRVAEAASRHGWVPAGRHGNGSLKSQTQTQSCYRFCCGSVSKTPVTWPYLPAGDGEECERWKALCQVTTVTMGKGEWALAGKTHAHSLAFLCGFTTLVCTFPQSLSVNESDTEVKWQAQTSPCKDRAVYHHPMEVFQENTD